MEQASTTAIRSRCIPMHKSATAKLHMRNFETVSRKWDVEMTITTNRFPITADNDMNHTGILKAQFPIRSSQGLNASGAG